MNLSLFTPVLAVLALQETIVTLVICLFFGIAMYAAHVKLPGIWKIVVMFLCGAIIVTILGIYLYKLLMTL